MKRFDLEKKGYNKAQVDKHLLFLEQEGSKSKNLKDNLLKQLKTDLEKTREELGIYKSKNQTVSEALLAAVKTGREIENNSKSLYEEEIKRVRVLYDKWEKFLDEMIKQYPKLKNAFDPETILKAFRDSIETTIRDNFRSISKQKEENSESAVIGVRGLINKMNQSARTANLMSGNIDNFRQREAIGEEISTVKRNPKPSEESILEVKLNNEYINETKRIKGSHLKPIAKVNLEENDGYETAVDKYMDEDDKQFEKSAYSKTLLKNANAKKKVKMSASGYPIPSDVNESGFDLKEALSPTEDLSDIMKSFGGLFDEDKN